MLSKYLDQFLWKFVCVCGCVCGYVCDKRLYNWVPLGWMLGPLLFNIYLNDLLPIMFEIAYYGYDCTYLDDVIKEWAYGVVVITYVFHSGDLGLNPGWGAALRQ